MIYTFNKKGPEMENLICENCKTETLHVQRDMGFGWTDFGGYGRDHACPVWECQECGALRSGDDE
jgi:hypothetical protein